MSYCPQCGVQNPDAARFCDQCGTALVPTTAATTPVAGAPLSPTSGTSAPSTPPSYAAPAPGATVAAPTSVASTSSSLTCSQCGASAIPGEAFCDNCGAPLNAPTRAAAPVPQPSYSSSVPSQPQYPPPQPAQPVVSQPPAVTALPTFNVPPVVPAAPVLAATAVAPVAPATPVAPAAPPRTTLAPASLIITATGAVLPLPAAASVIIGRADPVSKFTPDIDLTPHGALDQGVGRRHARLSITNGQMIIEDLDSTNGTIVGGNKLSARQPTVLPDGEAVQLGRLAMRIQY